MARVFIYLFQVLIYTLLLWMGFDHAGVELPTPIEAPWVWLVVFVAPLIPWRWGDYHGDGSSFGMDGGFGDGGD